MAVSPVTVGVRSRVSLIALSQLVSYGTLYYSFGAVLPLMAEDLGLSIAVASSAFSAALLTSAASAIAVGFMLNRIGGRTVVVIGATVGTAGLLAWSVAESYPALLISWITIGAAGPFVYYETALFSVMALVPADARTSAFSVVTLVGGLASLVYIPAIGFASDLLGWRPAILIAGGVYLITTLAFARAVTGARRRDPLTDPRVRSSQAPSHLIRWLTGVAVGGPGFSAGAVAAFHVTALIEFGHNHATAVLLASTLGLSAVALRLMLGRLMNDARRFLRAVAGIYVLHALAFAALGMFGSNLAAAWACTAVMGAAIGLSSLVRPVLVLSNYAPSRFGQESGWLASLNTLAQAGGPALSGALLVLTGQISPVVFALALPVMAGAAGLLWLSGSWRPGRTN